MPAATRKKKGSPAAADSAEAVSQASWPHGIKQSDLSDTPANQVVVRVACVLTPPTRPDLRSIDPGSDASIGRAVPTPTGSWNPHHPSGRPESTVSSCPAPPQRRSEPARPIPRGTPTVAGWCRLVAHKLSRTEPRARVPAAETRAWTAGRPRKRPPGALLPFVGRCSSHREWLDLDLNLAHWRRRHLFALRLAPHRWFFGGVRARLRPAGAILACLAAPAWLRPKRPRLRCAAPIMAAGLGCLETTTLTFVDTLT